MPNTENNYTETDLGNISLNPRGEYDNSAAYEYLDTVSYQGGSYFCLAELETTITGIAPDAGRNSEHWQMIAAPGDMTPEYTAAYNDVIKKAVQVETSRAAVELAQQEIEAVQTDVQQLHSDTVQAAQEAENSKNSAANSAQSAEQSRKTVSESEQNIKGQITGFDSRVSEAVEQSKAEINTTKQQAIDTITNQQNTSVNTVKTEGEKIITRVGNDAKTVADDRVTVEEAAQTVLNNAQEVAQNTQTVASNTKNAAASAESAKTSADNATQSAKSVEDASKQIEQNKKDIDSLKEDLSNKITKFYASNQGETHITDSDSGKIQDMIIYGRSSQFTTTGKNLANGQNVNFYINGSVNICGSSNNDTGMVIDVSKLTNVTISTRSIQDRYRVACVNTLPTYGNSITCYNGKNKDSTKDSYTIDTTDYNYLIVNATKLEDIQAEKGSEATTYEPYTGGQPSPSPDYPQEIKSVVNPTVKVCGKNLLKYAQNFPKTGYGITLSVENGGIRMQGTALTGGNLRIVDPSIEEIKANYPVVTASLKVDGTYDGIMVISDATDNEWKALGSVDSNTISTLSLVTNRLGVFLTFTRGKTYDVMLYPQIEKGSTATSYEPYTEQTVTLPYTLNAIPVTSGGNVTIDGQQYIADYVDVERGKLVRMVDTSKLDSTQSIVDKTEWLLAEPQEIALTKEEITAFKALATYYPVTSISVTSEQLDGYTVFNYPVSMQNGWNYVKQQLNDNRDYIYDMDLQSAEAYVNSEYAVALTELEV